MPKAKKTSDRADVRKRLKQQLEEFLIKHNNAQASIAAYQRAGKHRDVCHLILASRLQEWRQRHPGGITYPEMATILGCITPEHLHALTTRGKFISDALFVKVHEALRIVEMELKLQILEQPLPTDVYGDS